VEIYLLIQGVKELSLSQTITEQGYGRPLCIGLHIGKSEELMHRETPQPKWDKAF
jgi:hypothetical protein